MEEECCLYTGHTDLDGYGKLTYRVNGKEYNEYIHRIMYRHHVGELIKGLVLDHLCRNRSCINPDHLEQVTQKENTNRGLLISKHCSNGHEYTPENTAFTNHKNGYRVKKCRECFKAIYRRKRKS